MVGGATARSCTVYLNDAGLGQSADEETDGTLHSLAEGSGATSPLLSELSRQATAREPPPEGPLPLREFYAARLVMTSLAEGGQYRVDSYESPAIPSGIADRALRIETSVRSFPLKAALPGLYGRARRQLNFEPGIDKLHATFTDDQLRALPVLSGLITKEMSLVRLGSSGEPGLLTKELTVTPRRAVRVKVGDLVYVIQAYELRSLIAPSSGKDCK